MSPHSNQRSDTNAMSIDVIPSPPPSNKPVNVPVPFESIQGEKLTHEQSAYLDGFFAGLRERGMTFSNAAPNPVKPADAGDLIFEERVKRELHPLDAYPLLLEHAALNKAPDKENIFRF